MRVNATYDQRMWQDAQGIDLVVGAKGSPMQVILSSIYHLDVPTGNIAYQQALEIANHRMAKKAIPMAVGDSCKGTRIVGTTPASLAHYDARFASGKVWDRPVEAVIGAQARGAHGARAGRQVSGVTWTG